MDTNNDISSILAAYPQFMSSISCRKAHTHCSHMDSVKAQISSFSSPELKLLNK